MNHRIPMSRRAFVCGTAPLLLPASVFGQKAASNRITVGVIGVGRQTVTVNLKQFLAMPDVQVVAVCDVDAWRLSNARQQVEEAYARQAASGVYKGCKTFRDSNEVLADKSIDAGYGELVQWDTSNHDWLEGRGERCATWCGWIDDATSRSGGTVRQPTGRAEMGVLWQYLERQRADGGCIHATGRRCSR